VKEVQISEYFADMLRECEQRGKESMADSIVAGIDGEPIFRQELRELLGNGWTAFCNQPTGHGDIDCVLVGPSGLFAFEIKHHWGLIIYQNGRWLQLKVGAHGKPYRGSLKNPSLQLLAGVRSLKERLAENEVKDVWVEAAVIFTHPDARLIVRGDTAHVRIIKLDELADVIRPDGPGNEKAQRAVQQAIEQIESIRMTA